MKFVSGQYKSSQKLSYGGRFGLVSVVSLFILIVLAPLATTSGEDATTRGLSSVTTPNMGMIPLFHSGCDISMITATVGMLPQ